MCIIRSIAVYYKYHIFNLPKIQSNRFFLTKFSEIQITQIPFALLRHVLTSLINVLFYNRLRLWCIFRLRAKNIKSITIFIILVDGTEEGVFIRNVCVWMMLDNSVHLLLRALLYFLFCCLVKQVNFERTTFLSFHPFILFL